MSDAQRARGGRSRGPTCWRAPLHPSFTEATMRCYQQQYRFYCDVDLDARSMHVCIVDHERQAKVHKEHRRASGSRWCVFTAPGWSPGAATDAEVSLRSISVRREED